MWNCVWPHAVLCKKVLYEYLWLIYCQDYNYQVRLLTVAQGAPKGLPLPPGTKTEHIPPEGGEGPGVVLSTALSP